MVSEPDALVCPGNGKVEIVCPKNQNGTEKIVHEEFDGRRGNMEVAIVDANGQEGNISSASIEGSSHIDCVCRTF